MYGHHYLIQSFGQYHKKYYSFIIESPVKKNKKRIRDTFVDDKSQITTNDPQHYPQNFNQTKELTEILITKVTKNAQEFEKKSMQ